MGFKLERLSILEVSGVDDPANEAPGWAILKALTSKKKSTTPLVVEGVSLGGGGVMYIVRQDAAGARTDAELEDHLTGVIQALMNTVHKAKAPRGGRAVRRSLFSSTNVK